MNNVKELLETDINHIKEIRLYQRTIEKLEQQYSISKETIIKIMDREAREIQRGIK